MPRTCLCECLISWSGDESERGALGQWETLDSPKSVIHIQWRHILWRQWHLLELWLQANSQALTAFMLCGVLVFTVMSESKANKLRLALICLILLSLQYAGMIWGKSQTCHEMMIGLVTNKYWDADVLPSCSLTSLYHQKDISWSEGSMWLASQHVKQ